jgi:hypothetical protein
MEQRLGPSPLRVSLIMGGVATVSQGQTFRSSQECVRDAYFCNNNQRAYGAPDAPYAPSGVARQAQ